MRKPISKVLIPKESGRGGKIGAIDHPPEGNLASVRREEAHEKSEAVKGAVQTLEKLMSAGLARDAHVGVGDWRRDPTLEDLPPELRDIPEPDPLAFEPPPLRLLEQLSPARRARHAKAVEDGERKFHEAVTDWRQAVTRQTEVMASLRAETEAHNRRLTELEQSLAKGDPAAVAWYAAQVLSASPYPKRLKRKVQTAFDGATRTLRVHLEIPPESKIVPNAGGYKYVRGSDEIEQTERPAEERSAIYARVVAQTALRSLHEVFTTDVSKAIGSVALSIQAVAVDPATGKDAILTLASLSVSRAVFEDLDLARVEPLACLQRLSKASPLEPAGAEAPAPKRRRASPRPA